MALVVAGGTVSCSSRTVDAELIGLLPYNPNDKRLVVVAQGVASPDVEKVSVDESDTRIVITVRVREVEGAGTATQLLRVPVELSSPVDTRSITDGAGRPLEPGPY